MDITKQKDALLEFLFNLPLRVERTLSERAIDIIMRIHDIGGANGLIVKEIWWLYEGVRQVLAGEESPSELVAFMERDDRIEEDNRPKVASIAYEIQTKIFDAVLPILKEAGFTVKEGRVAKVITNSQLPITNGENGVSPYVPMQEKTQSTVAQNPNKTQNTNSSNAPIDEKHLRALLRIASGTTYTEDRLREQFETLPEGLKGAITSVDTANIIQNIAKKYMLHVDQMGSLASETGLVLLGFTHPRSFVANLSSRLRVNESRALEIAKDISAQILVKVREALRGLHGNAENPKSEIRPASRNLGAGENPKQIPLSASQIQNQPLPKKLDILAGQAEASSEELNAQRYPPTGGLNTSSRTPYSPDAKWNTGIARDLKTGASRLNQEERVGPTGWKPNAGGNTEIRNPKSPPSPGSYGRAGETNSTTQNTNKPIPSSRKDDTVESLRIPMPPTLTVPPASSQKTRPASESVFPPRAPSTPSESDDFLSQKLNGPVGGGKEVGRYTTDPYREPTE